MRPRLRSEHGFSLVPAIAVLGLLVLLGGVAVQEAISALGQTRQSELRKRALQAADAAIDSAVYALNRGDVMGGINIDPLNPGSVQTQNCIVGTGALAGTEVAALDPTAPPDGDGRRWCPATEPEVTPEGAAWTFRVSEVIRVGAEACTGDGVLSLDREIVAVGTAGDRVRRIRSRLRASVAMLSGAAVQSASSQTAMQMSGTARVLGDVASNFDIAGAATNVIAGSAIPGPDRQVTGVIPAGTTRSACSKFVLPAVNPGDSVTAHDNAAMSRDCVTVLMLSTPCKPLLITTGGVKSPTSDAFANSSAGKPVLHVWGNGRATLNGDTYSFCSIRLESSATLQIRAATPITRIFLRDPSECSGVPNAGQIVIDGSARIVNCHAQTQPQSLQIYALGATTQTIAGAGLLESTAMATACGTSIPLAGVPMVLYAPRSRVELGGTTALAGQVAANLVSMSGAAAVQPVNALVNLNRLGSRPVLPLYQPYEYVECVGRTFAQLPASDPSQGC